jgi:predicted Co/Zn/Cd cation transporter (cation efflux family)
MTQLQGFGALLFGAVALAFVGALAILFGGPLEITLALAAVFAAYTCQWCLFAMEHAFSLNRRDEGTDLLGRSAFWLQIACIALGAASFLLSVWF